MMALRSSGGRGSYSILQFVELRLYEIDRVVRGLGHGQLFAGCIAAAFEDTSIRCDLLELVIPRIGAEIAAAECPRDLV
ncbi:MAG: hypothetical protein MJE77_09805, partial [Proteobacteria bacterium]|nr:hypothetical protein [Pseudomonadota bacterium]